MYIAHNPTNVYLTPDQVRMCLGDVAMIMYTTLKVRGFDASVRGRGGGYSDTSACVVSFSGVSYSEPQTMTPDPVTYTD